jgi:hypothetical protein
MRERHDLVDVALQRLIELTDHLLRCCAIVAISALRVPPMAAMELAKLDRDETVEIIDLGKLVVIWAWDGHVSA